ncbi:MAG: hypothetical protein ACI95T_001612 [Flavobacteriales bacterium]
MDVTNHPGLNKLFNDSEYQKIILQETQEKYKKIYKAMNSK